MNIRDLRNFTWYTGNLGWLHDRTIFLTKHGSQAYGTATPESDLDVKGIAVAPREYYLGFLQGFEQAETRTPLDAVVYDVRKFFKLAADNNPNILEMLFTDEADWILPADGYVGDRSLWNKIISNRSRFLSRRVKHTFSGYAVAQLKRIRTHRAFLLDPPKAAPQRSTYGLPEGEPTIGKEQLGIVEARVRKLGDSLGGQGLTKDEVQEMEEALVTNVVQEVNLHRDLIPVILAERRYANACRTWKQYQDHQANRNPKRAALEARYGYDCKHAMHLVRLLRMAAEILRGEGVIVRRPDAEELLHVRNGGWRFDQLERWAQEKEASLEALYHSSSLPDEPDRRALDSVLVLVVGSML